MAAMRRINLLPPELAAKRRSRQLMSLIAAGAVGVLVLLGIVYVAQRARLGSERNKTEQQQQRNAALQREVAGLQQFAGQQMELQSKQALLSALSRNDILWSGVLQDVSLAIPGDDWLTSFTGTTSPAGAAAATGVGQIQIAGCTLVPSDGDYLNVAQFLVQIAKPLSVADEPFLTRAERAKVIPGTTSPCPVSFNAQLTLTEKSRRIDQGRERKV